MNKKISLHKGSLFDDEKLNLYNLLELFISKYKRNYGTGNNEGRYESLTQDEKKNLILVISYIRGVYPDIISHQNTLYGMDYEGVTQKITMQILFSNNRVTLSQIHQTFRMLETFKYVLDNEELPDGNHFTKLPYTEENEDDD